VIQFHILEVIRLVINKNITTIYKCQLQVVIQQMRHSLVHTLLVTAAPHLFKLLVQQLTYHNSARHLVVPILVQVVKYAMTLVIYMCVLLPIHGRDQL